MIKGFFRLVAKMKAGHWLIGGLALVVIGGLLSPGIFAKDANAINVKDILILVVTLFVPFITTALLESVHSGINKVKEGRDIYTGIKGHYVLIGYNRYATQIIKRKLTGNKAKAIILTTTNPIKLRDSLNNELNKEIAKRVIIYAGDAMLKEKIETLNLLYSERLYLLDEAQQSHTSQYTRNLSILKTIVEVVESRTTPLLVYMEVKSNKAYNLLQRVDIPQNFFHGKDGNVVVDFRPFNFYENWARMLWSSHVLKDENNVPKYEPLDFEPLENTHKYVHLVISGFNSMGRALLLEAIRLCHYPNFVEAKDGKPAKNRTIISVFDDKIDVIMDSFNAQYPKLQERIDDVQIDFYNMGINSLKARDLVRQWTCDINKLLTIAICEKDADAAMTQAVNLPEAVYYQKEAFIHDADKPENNNRTRVLVRQELDASSSDAIFAYQNRIAYPHIRMFGSFRDGLGLAQLDDRIAMCINGIYDEKSSKGEYLDILYASSLSECLEKMKDVFSQENKDSAWKQKWLELPENKKWANRFQADMYGTYIRILNRNSNLPRAEYEIFREKMAEIEHRRWLAERIVAGWRQKDEGSPRVDLRHIHSQMIPYAELDDKIKVMDFNVIATAQYIAKEAKKMNFI